MTTRILFWVTCLGWAGSVTAEPYAVKRGPFPVRDVESLTLHDGKRGKDLVVRVYYPDGAGRFPVIVFSHGFGAGKDAFAALGKHWASRGYVSIHPNHADGGALGGMKRGRQMSRDERRKQLRDRLRKGGGLRSMSGGLADRVHDVSAVVDALDAVEAKVPTLKGKLDRRLIGVSGHSFGACTAMLVGGVTADIGGKKNQSLVDPRVKCILPFSAAGTGEYGLTECSWDGLKLPALYVTGTRDVRPGKDFLWRLEPFKLSPKGDKYLVVMDGATHFNFGGGPPSMARFAGRVDTYTPLSKDLSVAFWDAHLKGKAAAKAYLSPGGFGQTAGKVATIRVK